MKVRGACLKKVEPKYSFAYSSARKFQYRFLEWMNEEKEQFCLMKAPTGAGKTAAFTELCQKNRKTLLIYPTNALLDQQAERLEKHQEYDFNIKILNSDTLEKSGSERLEELLSIGELPKFEIIVTNPDILQAIIQNQYTDPAGKAMEFFNNFDSVVYDEFHFYSDFESSGLILQSKIIAERRKDSQIVFCSATPNEAYLNTIQNSISDDVKIIEAEYRENGDKFRESVEVNRIGETITSEKEKALEIMEEKLQGLENPNEPKIAVIFNSAYRSNQFYKFLCDQGLESRTEIDNGYDTKSNVEIDYTKPVLITTSKSEVGLDFDIELMLMEKPQNSSSFIQRFGRAGRKSESEIYLFNFGQVSWWQDEIEFPEFEKRIYNTIEEYNSDKNRIQEFMGLRGAKAVLDRNKENMSSQYSEMYQDFGNLPNYGKWKSFLKNLETSQDAEGTFFESAGLPRKTQNIIEFTEECAEVLTTLRGRSLSEKIKYPRGNEEAITSYDLLSVFQNYSIEDVKEDFIKVKPKEESNKTNLRITYPGFDNEYKNYEGGLQRIEDKLQKWMTNKAKRSKIQKEADINMKQLQYFLRLVKITRSAIPSQISYGENKFNTERDGKSIKLEVIDD